MEQKFTDYDDLLDNDSGDDGNDTDDWGVDEDEQPQRTVVIPVPMMHVFEAKELMVWCALLVLLAFVVGAFGTLAILKSAGVL